MLRIMRKRTKKLLCYCVSCPYIEGLLQLLSCSPWDKLF